MAEKLITPEAMLSYPALFEPKPTPSGELKYGCALVFQEGADLSALKKAALAALEERWGAKAKEMLQKKQLKWPFRDGAERDAQGYGPGTTFINVSSKQQPGVVDRYAGPDGRPRPITDPRRSTRAASCARACGRSPTTPTAPRASRSGCRTCRSCATASASTGACGPRTSSRRSSVVLPTSTTCSPEAGCGSRAGRAASGDRLPPSGRRDPLGRRSQARRPLGLRPAPEHRPVVRLLGDRRWRRPDLASRRSTAAASWSSMWPPAIRSSRTTPWRSSA